MTDLAGWQNFYVIVGSSAGALIGLQFVVMTLIANLPLKRDGIVIQHFNGDADRPAVLLAVAPNLFAATSVDRGCGFEQLEPSPDYQAVAD